MADSSTVSDVYSLADLIGQQVDLLWAAALSLLAFSIVVGCRYFIEKKKVWRWQWLGLLWALSSGCFLMSLIFGYLARGALIIMTVSAVQNKGYWASFQHAEDMSLLQFTFVFLGILLLVAAFAGDFKGVAGRIIE